MQEPNRHLETSLPAMQPSCGDLNVSVISSQPLIFATLPNNSVVTAPFPFPTTPIQTPNISNELTHNSDPITSPDLNLNYRPVPPLLV